MKFLSILMVSLSYFTGSVTSSNANAVMTGISIDAPNFVITKWFVETGERQPCPNGGQTITGHTSQIEINPVTLEVVYTNSATFTVNCDGSISYSNINIENPDLEVEDFLDGATAAIQAEFNL